MTVTAKITTTERDAAIAEHIRAARLEINRVMQRLAPVGNLIVARQQLAAALAVVEPQVEEWTVDEILQSEG